MAEIKQEHKLDSISLELDRGLLMRSDPGETNKLILKIMALYSKVNKEELIATLCTMDEEYQETITAMIEECSTR